MSSDCVIEVHSITSAPPGWKFVQSEEPVACFALVTVANVAHSGKFQERMVIGIAASDINSDLLGMEVNVVTGDVHFDPS